MKILSCVHVRVVHETSPLKNRPSHPLRRTRFGQYTRPHQLHCDQEMGTAISCTECSQVAGLIQKVDTSSSKAPSLCAAVCSSCSCFVCMHYFHTNSETRALSINTSLVPRLSVPDFVSQLWRECRFSPKLQEKIRNREPGNEATLTLHTYTSHLHSTLRTHLK